MRSLKNILAILCLTLSSIVGQAQFVINGSAQDLGGGEYMLTPAQNGRVGTIWSDQKISLNAAFEVELEVYFGTNDGGADGITFSLQSQSNTVGTSGGGLGIGGITPSLITEMDTYQNGGYGDPVYDHIALTTNTVDHRGTDNLVSPTQIVNGQGNVEDGAWYRFKATWDPATQIYEVSVNGATRLFYQGDVINTVFGGDPNVFWGFTGSTGGRNNLQKVRIINTTIIDLYECTETPNDATFCPNPGAVAVNLSIGNVQAGSSYEWFDSPDRSNSLGTGTSYTTAPLTDNTDYYVLATTTGGTSTATVGPTPTGTLTDIWDVNYMAGYDRDFIAHVPIVINSVDLEHPAWTGGCGAAGTTKIAEIDVYVQGSGVPLQTVVVQAPCGGAGTVPLNLSLPAGSYTMKLRGIVGGTFRLTNDGSERAIPGVITLEENNVTGPGSTNSYSSVFFNWNIEGGQGTTECLLSVKAEKDCPPCTTYPAVNIGSAFTYCNDTDTTITANTTAANVLWNTGETTKTITVTEGTYTVAAWDEETCESYGSITIDKECPPNLVLVDTFEVCSGVTSAISAYGVQTGFWGGTDAFTQISDSVIEVNLETDAEYFVTNYTKLNILSNNINFEDPVIGASTFQIVNANTVPGWQTTATDNMVEIWSAGFQGVQPYLGNQFMELNANQNAALYQDVLTTPGAIMGISLAHRGRGGVDVMELLAGPPGGPYQTIQTYSDGLAWGHYTDYYTVPAGQNTTQFMFQTVSCNGGACGGSGNFLDAVEFFKIREENDTVYVLVNQTPIVGLGNDSTICGSIDITLDAGSMGQSYLWNTPAPTQTINVTGPGTYSVIVENLGCIAYDTVTISQGAEVALDLGANDSICDGEIKILNTQNPGLTHSWNTGETSAVISVDTSGEYIVQVSSSDGCIVYDTVQVVVNELPQVTLGNDTVFCGGDAIILDAGYSTSTFGVLWSNGVSDAQTLEVSSTGTHAVKVSSAVDCYDEDTIVVTIQDAPNVELGADTVICDGQSVELDASNSNATYLWSTSSVSPTLEISTSGDFSVVVTDNIGCEGRDTFNLVVNPMPFVDLGIDTTICAIDSLVLDATNTGFDYDWSTGATTATITVNQTGSYHVAVSDSIGCLDRDTLDVVIRAMPVVNLHADTAICRGDEMTIDAGNGALDIVWSTAEITQTIDVSTADVYSVIVTDDMGCATYDTFELEVYELPIVSLSAPTDPCFASGNVELTENPIGGVFEGTGITQGGEFDPTHTGLTADVTTWAYYTYTDENNCVNKDSAAITVRMEPDPTIGMPDTIVCAGDQTQLTVSSSVTATYEWYMTSSFTMLQAGNTYDAEEGGYFFVLAVNDYCSAFSDTVLVELVTPQVFLTTDMEYETILEGESTTITATSPIVAGYAYTYQWEDLTTGDQSTGVSWTVSPEDSTYYLVTATLRGCPIEDEILVAVSQLIVLPDAFTPNGDGVNDEFTILNIEDYPGAQVSIFNRWGNLLYDTNKGGLYKSAPWDGSLNGKELPAGVYYYTINLNDGRSQPISGSLQMLK